MIDASRLDTYARSQTYEDRTLVRVSVRRTEDDTYASGWRYTLHYGRLTPGPETLPDGTLRRYDNSHERTKGHECHVAPDPEPRTIDFPGMPSLYERFWREIPKRRFDPPENRDR